VRFGSGRARWALLAAISATAIYFASVPASANATCDTLVQCEVDQVQQTVNDTVTTVNNDVQQAEQTANDTLTTVQNDVQQAEDLAGRTLTQVQGQIPTDTYYCVLQGRSTSWTPSTGDPTSGTYGFSGVSDCAHVDNNTAVDGHNDTGVRSGTFTLTGTYQRIQGSVGACTWHLDGTGQYSTITEPGDAAGNLSFKHEMYLAGGQGVISVPQDPTNGILEGGGGMSLVSAQTALNPIGALTAPGGPQIGCATVEPNDFFIDGAVIIATGYPAVPTNTTPPSISGTAQSGHTVTASNGAWTSNPTSYGYQWQRCDSTGANCVNLAGATSQSYAVQGADVGDTLRVVVTATNAGGSGSATSAPTAQVLPAPPTNTTAPSISGTAQSGQTVTASNGAWTNSPTSYRYQWRRCDSGGGSCSDISGASSQNYAVQDADVGDTLRVVVTAVNSGGSGSATSAQTAQVLPAPPTNVTPPTISGSGTAGSTETASNGTWTGNPTSYAYQWKLCDTAGNNCSNIAGATSQTYVVQISDTGHDLRVVVTASNAAGSASATSPPVLVGD